MNPIGTKVVCFSRFLSCLSLTLMFATSFMSVLNHSKSELYFAYLVRFLTL